MKYRSRLEMLSGMLRAASRGGASKTRMMYSAYLTSSQSKEYLRFLLDRRLLTFDARDESYKLTEKGLRFLQTADRMERLVGPEKEVQRQGDETQLSEPA